MKDDQEKPEHLAEEENGFDGSELQTRCMPADASSDPRAFRDVVLESVASMVREAPTVPSSSSNLEQPWAAALSSEQGSSPRNPMIESANQ